MSKDKIKDYLPATRDSSALLKNAAESKLTKTVSNPEYEITKLSQEELATLHESPDGVVAEYLDPNTLAKAWERGEMLKGLGGKALDFSAISLSAGFGAVADKVKTIMTMSDQEGRGVKDTRFYAMLTAVPVLGIMTLSSTLGFAKNLASNQIGKIPSAAKALEALMGATALGTVFGTVSGKKPVPMEAIALSGVGLAAVKTLNNVCEDTGKMSNVLDNIPGGKSAKQLAKSIVEGIGRPFNVMFGTSMPEQLADGAEQSVLDVGPAVQPLEYTDMLSG